MTFVLGGAASGKSHYAETLLKNRSEQRIYIATAEVYDAEMADKVAAHKRMRGKGWHTIEEPLDLPKVLSDRESGEVILIDCATLWLTNLVLGDHDVDTATEQLIAAIAACPAPVVIVSNEVGQGIVPDNALSRKFRNAQGKLNRDLAAVADRVVAVMAGLPLVLKG
ncbi:bifunctional adenosylcobinamide kinase/adenosylcobinamide-phosphate guanylyltransferase [Yoonia sp. 208BN28-4]